MHLFLLLSAIITLLPVTLYAGWESVSSIAPRPLGLAVVFPDGEIISAARERNNSVLYRSKDSGSTWIQMENTPIQKNNRQISAMFVSGDSTLYWCYGRAQVLYRSTDRGISWDSLATIGGDKIYIDSRGTIWLVNISKNRISYSVDQGATWQETEFSGDCSTPNMTCDDAGNVYMQCTGTVYRFHTGMSPVPVLQGGLSFCVSANGALFAALDSAIVRSVDNGRNWDTIVKGVVEPNVYYAAHENHVMVSWAELVHRTWDKRRYTVSILQSENGKWQRHKCPTMLNHTLPARNPYNVVSTGSFIVGHMGMQPGSYGLWLIVVSVDGGYTWKTTTFASGNAAYIDSDSRDILYAGMNKTGGVIRSRDRGKTWESYSEGLNHPFHTVQSLHIDKDDQLYVSNSAGIFRRNPTAPSWECIFTTDSLENCLLLPAGDILFATTGYKSYKGMIISQFFRSTDKGTSWMDISSSAEYDIVSLTTVDSKVIFAATVQGILSRSDDSGKTWSRISYSIPTGKVLESIMLCNNGTLLGVSYKPYGDVGNELYRSDDSGKTWKFTNSVYTAEITAFKRMVDGSVWTVGGKIHKSSDNGRTWMQMLGTPMLNVCQTSDGQLYGCSIYGSEYGDPCVLITSSDKGEWQRSLGLVYQDHPGKYTPSYKVYCTPRGEVYAVTDSDILYSADRGQSWELREYWGHVNTDIEIFKGGKVLVATSKGVYYSTDRCKTMTRISDMTELRSFTPLDSGLVALQNGRVWISYNTGVTWEKFDDNMKNPGAIYSLARKGRYLFAVSERGVYRCQPVVGAFNDWVRVLGDLTGIEKPVIATTDSIVIVCGVFKSGQSEFCWQSSTDGDTWESLSIELTVPVTLAASDSLIVIAAGSPNRQQKKGVFLSTDHAKTWRYLGQNDENAYMTALSNSHIFTCMELGVMRFTMSEDTTAVIEPGDTISTTNIPEIRNIGETVFTVMPHPVDAYNGDNFVQIAIDKTEYAEVNLYTSTGAKVRTLYSGILTTGQHTIHWDASGIAPGVYICVGITSGQRSARMVVIR